MEKDNKKTEQICLSVKEATDMCRKDDEEYYNLDLVRTISDHLTNKFHKTYEELAK